MGLDYYSNFLNGVAQSPYNYYKDLNQATVDELWQDTDRIKTVKEQHALPFTDEYDEYEAWVTDVSDNNITVTKNIGDFVSVMFRDWKHKTNYKGQYYKINIDGEHEETYICYDPINKLHEIADFKAVRCNNVLTWIDKNTGKIKTLPCYVGDDISSTNNQYTKDGTTPNVRLCVYVQATDYTKSIGLNQRFMFEHKHCFKIESINDYEESMYSDGQVTFIKFYIAWSPILPTDNTELNVCDYYVNQYKVKINQTSPITLHYGDKLHLDATVYDSDENTVQNRALKWTSSNEDILTVTDEGDMTIIEQTDKSVNVDVIVTCALSDNIDIKDSITTNIVKQDETVNDNKTIIVKPSDYITLYTGDEQEYEVSVYNNGAKTDDEVICTPNFVNDKIYTLTKTDKGYKVTDVNNSVDNLVLTFTSGDLSSVQVEIELRGML